MRNDIVERAVKRHEIMYLRTIVARSFYKEKIHYNLTDEEFEEVIKRVNDRIREWIDNLKEREKKGEPLNII